MKGNQPGLLAQIAAKFEDATTPTTEVTTHNKGHGRIEIRTLKACSAEGVDWPGCQQVCRIERVVCHVSKDTITTETVYAVTSLNPTEAPPAALLGLNRGHWRIENTCHYVRDVTLREDASRVRKGSGPQVMATLRNTAISLLHRLGLHAIAATIRELAADVGRVLAMVGIRE